MTVVIVEDDEGMRESVALLLSVHGYTTRTFAAAEAFLADRTARDGGTVLLVDHHLPGMQGVDLLRHLSDTGQGLPAILVSARLTTGIAEAATAAGARHVLEKPIAPDRLLACLAEAIDDAPAQGPR